MRHPFLLLPVLLAAPACGHDATGPGSSIRLESSRAVTVRIGQGGGQLRTTDTQGRIYLLDIPALALRDSTDVTLTPVASYELPEGVTLTAAAQFAPAGLRLAVPGRLAIVVPGGAPDAAGFSYSGQGDSLHLDLMGRRGDTLFLPVRHFSGAGAAATQDVALLTPGGPVSGSIQAFIQLSALSQTGHATGTYDVQAMTAVLDGWMTSVIIPALQSVTTEQALVDAAGLYTDWLEVIECGGDACSPVGTALGGAALHLFPDDVRVNVLTALASYETGREALAAAIDANAARLREQCITAHDVQAAANIVYWIGYASRVSNVFLLLQSSNELNNFCVKVVVDSLTFPDLITSGTPATLRIRAGLSFGGGPIDRTDPLLVTVSAGSASPASASGNTTGGTFSQAFTPDGQAPVFFGIRAALHRGGLDSLAGIGYADTVLTRNLDAHVSLTPTAAILDRGATAQFTATVTGLSGTAVTWSATGGSISGTGNTVTYTAGSTPGTYAVTATSISDPAQHGTARIDILAPGGGSITVTSASGETRATATTGDGAPACDSHDNRILGPGELASQYEWQVGRCSVGIPANTGASRQKLVFSAASGTHVTISGVGADSVDHVNSGSISSRGFAAVVVTVSGGSVSYHLTGLLQPAGSVDGGAVNQGGAGLSFGPTAGPPIISKVVSSNPSSGLPQTTPINLSGTLSAGTYQIEMQAFASSQAGTNSYSGTQTFTLELGQ